MSCGPSLVSPISHSGVKESAVLPECAFVSLAFGLVCTLKQYYPLCMWWASYLAYRQTTTASLSIIACKGRGR